MADKEWYYSDGEDQHGPVSNAELKRLATEGELKPDNLVWCDGMDDWQPASEMKGLISQTKKKPKPARKAARPARRKSEPKPSAADAKHDDPTSEDSAQKDSAKDSAEDSPGKDKESFDFAEPEEDVDEVEEVEEVIEDEPTEEPEDTEEESEEEELLDESLGLDEAQAGSSHPPSHSTVVNVAPPKRGMAHSLVLLIVWAGCGVFVAVGGATFVMKWRSLEESAAVTAEAGAFVVQFVGAYVFARATERVLQLLADMSGR